MSDPQLLHARAIHNAFMSFAWQAEQTRSGKPKAVWTGEGDREPLYGEDAMKALEAQSKGSLPEKPPEDSGVRKIAKVAGSAAKTAGKATLVAGKATGQAAAKTAKVAAKATVRMNKIGGEVAASVGERIAKVGKSVAGSEILSGLTKVISKLDDIVLAGSGSEGLRRSKNKLKSIRNSMREKGFLLGALKGGQKFVFPYFDGVYRTNRRKYGRPAAIAMEFATIALNWSIGGTAKIAAPVVGAYVGSAFGPAGAVIGGLAGEAAGSWAIKGATKAASLITKSGANSAGASIGRMITGEVARRISGETASAAKQRKKAGGVLLMKGPNEPIGTAFPHIARNTLRKAEREGKPIGRGDPKRRIRRIARLNKPSAAELAKANIPAVAAAAKAIKKARGLFGFSEGSTDLNQILGDIRRQFIGSVRVQGGDPKALGSITDEQIITAMALATRMAQKATKMAEIRNEFEKFAWEDWKQIEGGKWRSPGGRVLSATVYERMKSPLGREGQAASKSGSPRGCYTTGTAAQETIADKQAGWKNPPRNSCPQSNSNPRASSQTHGTHLRRSQRFLRQR